jgi:hypothetical protein
MLLRHQVHDDITACDSCQVCLCYCAITGFWQVSGSQGTARKLKGNRLIDEVTTVNSHVPDLGPGFLSKPVSPSYK